MDGVKATYTPICHHIGVHHSHCGVATTPVVSSAAAIRKNTDAMNINRRRKKCNRPYNKSKCIADDKGSIDDIMDCMTGSNHISLQC